MILTTQLITDSAYDDGTYDGFDLYDGLDDQDQFGDIKISKEEGEFLLRKAKEILDNLGYETRIRLAAAGTASEYCPGLWSVPGPGVAYFDEVLNVSPNIVVAALTDGNLEVSMPTPNPHSRGRIYQGATIDNVGEVIAKLSEDNNLSEDIVNEFLDFVGKVDTLDLYGVNRQRELRVYKNPTFDEIYDLMNISDDNVGGFITPDKEVYIWNRGFADHYSVARKLGLKILFKFCIYYSEDGNFCFHQGDCSDEEDCGCDEIMKIIESKWGIKEELVYSDTIETLNQYGVNSKTQIRIYKNPSLDEIKSLLKISNNNVAGLILTNNDIYIWDRRIAEHDTVQNLLGDIELMDAFYIVESDRWVNGYTISDVHYKSLTGRDIMDTIESKWGIKEELVYVVKISTPDEFRVERTRELKIYKNPSLDEIKNLLSIFVGAIGGLYDNGIIYVWDRNIAVHQYVKELLHLNDPTFFYIYYSDSYDNGFNVISVGATDSDIIRQSIESKWGMNEDFDEYDDLSNEPDTFGENYYLSDQVIMFIDILNEFKVSIRDVIRDGGLRTDLGSSNNFMSYILERWESIPFNYDFVNKLTSMIVNNAVIQATKLKFNDPNSDFIDIFKIDQYTITWRKSKGEWMAYG